MESLSAYLLVQHVLPHLSPLDVIRMRAVSREWREQLTFRQDEMRTFLRFNMSPAVRDKCFDSTMDLVRSFHHSVDVTLLILPLLHVAPFMMAGAKTRERRFALRLLAHLERIWRIANRNRVDVVVPFVPPALLETLVTARPRVRGPAKYAKAFRIMSANCGATMRHFCRTAGACWDPKCKTECTTCNTVKNADIRPIHELPQFHTTEGVPMKITRENWASILTERHVHAIEKHKLDEALHDSQLQRAIEESAALAREQEGVERQRKIQEYYAGELKRKREEEQRVLEDEQLEWALALSRQVASEEGAQLERARKISRHETRGPDRDAGEGAPAEETEEEQLERALRMSAPDGTPEPGDLEIRRRRATALLNAQLAHVSQLLVPNEIDYYDEEKELRRAIELSKHH